MTEDGTPAGEDGRAGRLLAWSAHLFTASGLVLALLALEAIHHQRWTEAMLWLLLALAIDGIDGTLARAARVQLLLPRIDGEALDLIIDYLNYVLIPTLLMWRSQVLPPGWELEIAALILLSSLYVFVRRDMKTHDGYFRGFPALWNIVALYLFYLRPEPAAAAAVILLLCASSFAPVHFVHPFRVLDYGRWLLALSALWAIATAGLLLTGSMEALGSALLAISLSTAAALVGLGLLRSFRGPRTNQQNVTA
ncbi:MAG TPA: CDP-alcohol phosphatidyltransferase family protein [Pirellulaceae bacterium]|nr:CDP-alcohol phosphatidyltransferase family protein [Pirellulaceae bacterium]